MEESSKKLALAEQELSDTEEVECLVSGVGVASAEAAGGGVVMVVVALRMKRKAHARSKRRYDQE